MRCVLCGVRCLLFVVFVCCLLVVVFFVSFVLFGVGWSVVDVCQLVFFCWPLVVVVFAVFVVSCSLLVGRCLSSVVLCVLFVV